MRERKPVHIARTPMASGLSRRDFLKAAGTYSLGAFMSPLLGPAASWQPAAGGPPNVLVLVFDAFSAMHMALHGYERQTTPNLARIVERGIVYHEHRAASNYTTLGAGSLLTGALPWTHRALVAGDTFAPAFRKGTLFHSLPRHHSVLFSHNVAVNSLLSPLWEDIDTGIPMSSFLLSGHSSYDHLFGGDLDMATTGWMRALNQRDYRTTYSLYLRFLQEAVRRSAESTYVDRFPVGVPEALGLGSFVLEDVINWLGKEHSAFPQPYVAYIHLWPPHEPSRPPEDFYRFFAGDGYRPPEKPMHVNDIGQLSSELLIREHRLYDEFILYVDQQFGRLFERLESSGALENTWLVLTSDHGQLFERGFRYHFGPLLYEPVLRVPLVIFEPGRRSRLDIHAPTSAIDVLPTILHLTGEKASPLAEGSILPPFGGSDAGRPIYAQFASTGTWRQPIDDGTAMVIRDRYKLIYYLEDDLESAGSGRVELYDLRADPQELVEISRLKAGVAGELLHDLKQTILKADGPYR